MRLAFIRFLMTLLMPVGLCIAGPEAGAVPMELKENETFSIRLASNPTTGFRWNLAQTFDEKIVTLVEHAFLPPTKHMPGAGGEETWTFKTLAPGETTIELTYARPWEKNVPPAKRATYPILVK